MNSSFLWTIRCTHCDCQCMDSCCFSGNMDRIRWNCLPIWSILHTNISIDCRHKITSIYLHSTQWMICMRYWPMECSKMLPFHHGHIEYLHSSNMIISVWRLRRYSIECVDDIGHVESRQMIDAHWNTEKNGQLIDIPWIHCIVPRSNRIYRIDRDFCRCAFNIYGWEDKLPCFKEYKRVKRLKRAMWPQETTKQCQTTWTQLIARETADAAAINIFGTLQLAMHKSCSKSTLSLIDHPRSARQNQRHCTIHWASNKQC